VTTIGLGWPSTADPRPGTYYELFWNQGESGTEMVKLVESLNAIHTVNNLTSGRTYSFKVRGVNACGVGEFSTTLEVNMDSDVPIQMQSVRTAVQ
jgi:hypothetical protein